MAGLILYRRDRSVAGNYVVFTGIAGCVLWLFMVKLPNGFTLYRLLYDYVPGGSAMRVGQRIHFFLNGIFVPVVVVAVVCLTTSLSGLARVAIPVAAAALLLIEQIQTQSPAQFTRRQDRDLMASIPPPPADCRSFFVFGALPRPNESALLQYFYGPMSDAMILAYQFRVPTINGIATGKPDEWPSPPAWGGDYDRAIANWVEQNKLTNVCRLDFVTRSWSKYERPKV